MYLSASTLTIGCVMLVAMGLVPGDSDAWELDSRERSTPYDVELLSIWGAGWTGTTRNSWP